jgi:ferredoxin
MIPQSADDSASLKIPVVDANRCIGCGACEQLCPSRPYSAIYVDGVETHRRV